MGPLSVLGFHHSRVQSLLHWRASQCFGPLHLAGKGHRHPHRSCPLHPTSSAMNVPTRRSLPCCLNFPVNKNIRMDLKLGKREGVKAVSTLCLSHCSWPSDYSLEAAAVLCKTGTWFAGRAGREGGLVASEYCLICLKYWNIVLSLEIIASSQPFQSTAPVCASSALTIAGLGTDCTDIHFFQENK